MNVPERKTYTILTPKNDKGYYVIPEVEEVPKKYWGKFCQNKDIMWDVYDN